MFFDDLDGSHAQMPGASVITKPGPVFENLVLARLGQSANGRKASQESFEVRYDRGGLSLLEHHFGHPDPISCFVSLPR